MFTYLISFRLDGLIYKSEEVRAISPQRAEGWILHKYGRMHLVEIESCERVIER